MATVGDAGQRVGAGEVAQARLHRLVLGDVTHREHQGLRTPVVHATHPRLDREGAAVATQMPRFEGLVGGLGELAIDLLDGPFFDEHQDRTADELILGVPVELDRRIVAIEHHGALADQDRLERRLGQLTKAGFALLEFVGARTKCSARLFELMDAGVEQVLGLVDHALVIDQPLLGPRQRTLGLA